MSKTDNNTQEKKSKVFRLFAIAGAVIGVVFLVFFYRSHLTSQKRCAANLRALGTAMIVYAGDYDEKYPTADEWCDLLIEFTAPEKYTVPEKKIKCPANKKQRCSYAINPNVSPLSSSRLVLLFEAEGDWNRFGGPELLTFENHDGKGSNVLFNDGHVEFVTPEQFGKLKWKDEAVVQAEEYLSKPIILSKEETLKLRLESAQKLKKLGLLFVMYANDYNDKYPKEISDLKAYDRDNIVSWAEEKVEYLANGKDLTLPAQATIAYDKTLLAKGNGTNVLFNDGHVEFCKPEILKKLDIDAQSKPVADQVENIEQKEYTLRITDTDNNPVKGAKVYKYFTMFEERGHINHFQSDDKGIVSLTEDDIFRSQYEKDRGFLLYALFEEKLAGFVKLEHDMYDIVINLQLEQVCRVSGEIKSSSLENLGQELEWTNVYVFYDDHRPLSYSSKERKFEFLLPSGSYKLHGYGTNTYSDNRDIEIKAGQKELQVTLDLPADKLATLEGKPAPEFTNIKGWINSKDLTLANLRGKVVLLEFWGYWCGPCIQVMPKLIELHNEYHDDGLVIIAVHDDSVGSVKELKEKLKKISKERLGGQEIPFAIALDGGGSSEISGTDRIAQGATTAAYGIQSWPTCVLIDKTGKVVQKFHPSVPDMINELQNLLGIETDTATVEKLKVLEVDVQVEGKVQTKIEKNVQALPLKTEEYQLIDQLLSLVKEVEQKYPNQATHWPAGAAFYHIDMKGQITVWHYRHLWRRSNDCAEDEVGWGSSELVDAEGMYYLSDGTPLNSRWRERGGGMKDIRVKIGRTVNQNERVGIIHRHDLSSNQDLGTKDNLMNEIRPDYWRDVPIAIIVRVDKPLHLDGWLLGDIEINVHRFKEYDQLVGVGLPGDSSLSMYVRVRYPEKDKQKPEVQVEGKED